MTPTKAEAAAAAAADLHAKSRIEEVSVERLRFDRSYQRDPSQALVDDIASDWDVVASELILVSDRGKRPEGGEVEGGLFVVNGQHRSLAARKLNLPTIWARVIDLRKEEDPAKVEAGFRLKTNVRLGDRPLERFKAQLRAGDEESLHIERILDKFGTAINTQPSMEVGINGVTTVEMIYRVDHGSLLIEVLEVIRDAYGSVGGRTTTTPLLKSIAWFIEKHGAEIDRSRFIEKLQQVSIPALDRRARTMQGVMGGAAWMNYYRTLIELWNEKLHDRNKLEFRLRGSTRLAKGGSPRHRTWEGRDD